MIQVVIAGCAECHWSDDDEPLIGIELYNSVEEAKALFATQGWLTSGGRKSIEWKEHPQGGEHIVVGQGSVWILPETVKELSDAT